MTEHRPSYFCVFVVDIAENRCLALYDPLMMASPLGRARRSHHPKAADEYNISYHAAENPTETK